MVRFGLVLPREFSVFQLSLSFPFVEIITYFRLVFVHHVLNIMAILELLTMKLSYLQLFGRPQWLTVKCRSHSYVKKVS